MASPSELSANPACFSNHLFVEENKSYNQLVKDCTITQPYALHDILKEHHIPIDSQWKEAATDVIAAIAVATFESDFKSFTFAGEKVENHDRVLTAGVTAEKESTNCTIVTELNDKGKFKGAIVKSKLAVVSNRQVFPNNDLTTWLVDTNFRPDVGCVLLHNR